MERKFRPCVLKTRFCLLSVGAVDVVVPFLYRRYQKKKMSGTKKKQNEIEKKLRFRHTKRKKHGALLKRKRKTWRWLISWLHVYISRAFNAFIRHAIKPALMT